MVHGRQGLLVTHSYPLRPHGTITRLFDPSIFRYSNVKITVEARPACGAHLQAAMAESFIMVAVGSCHELFQGARVVEAPNEVSFT